MLLEWEDINLKTIKKNCTKPESIVAWNRQEGVMQMLLGRFNVDPNTDDEGGQSPVWIATGHQYEGVVGLLLERNDINPNTSN